MTTQPSFMTDLPTVNSNGSPQSCGPGPQHKTASSCSSTTTATATTSQSSEAAPSPTAELSSIPEEVASNIPETTSLPLAKVLVPTQVAVVAHPFTEQQSQQQSVLFQALTSQAVSQIIAVTVNTSAGDKQDVSVPAAQGVSCVQYVDEGGGTNAFASINGHMTSYPNIVYTTQENATMFTPNTANFYSTTNSGNFSQIDGENQAQNTGSVNNSFNEEPNVFHAMDESNVAEPENNHVACFPSSRLSAATMKWLIDNYEMADGMSVPRSTMYSHYLKHCSEQKMEPLNAASFGKLIRSVFAGLRTRRLGTRGNSKYHYYGIRLKPSSSMSKAMGDIVNTTYRQNPFMHIRRIRTEQEMKLENENCDDKRFLINEDKKQNGSQLQNKSQHQIYLGNASAAIPNVEIEIPGVPLPQGVTLDKINIFRNIYQKHCESFLEAVVNFQFGVVESLWHLFWNCSSNDENQSSQLSKATMMALLCYPPVQEFIKQTDYKFYQNLVDVLIPDVLRPIPSTLTQAIRNFAKSLEGWLRSAMSNCSSDIVNIKLSAISAFAQTLRRYTSLNHLAQAARAVLQSSTQIKQMTLDLSKVDFRNIQEQASWVCQCDDSTVHDLLCEFQQTLQHHLWLEEWASWLESIVHKTLKPYEGKEAYPKAARQFLLKWSFYSSLVIRDLTLRSAASFGSFHLLRLLYDEYMFYVIEHCIARATGTTSIAVMGEYLCLGRPEELTEIPEIIDNIQYEICICSEPDDDTPQNGSVETERDESSQKAEPTP